MKEWISVKDKLPKDRQEVLTFCLEYERVRVQEFYLEYGGAGGPWFMFGEQNHLLSEGRITHWMPLPDPPEEMAIYRMVGKIGPWARLGAEGVRYLATGRQGAPVHRRIVSAEKEGGNWRYLRVRLEGGVDVRSCWCGTNVYEEVNQDDSSTE